MIGWTKKRKRCPDHGLVLGKHPDDYRSRGDYCPACGKTLTVVSVPYLFQIYFHPAIMIVPGILVAFYGLFVFLDLRGCVVENRQHGAIVREQRKVEEQKSQEEQERIVSTLPLQWETLHTGMKSLWGFDDRWEMMQQYCIDNSNMPQLTSEQLTLFLQMLDTSVRDEAFALITKYISREEEQ